MDVEALRALLEQVQAGTLDIATALDTLRSLPYEPIGNVAYLDHHRLLRQGFPEFIYAEGKRPEEVITLMSRLVAQHGSALATRVTPEMARRVREELPTAVYDDRSRILRVGGPLSIPGAIPLRVGVLTAGTSDIPVAEEATQVLEYLGHHVTRVYDVGVAGLHRLLGQQQVLSAQDALIVVAGMEGALPSVVGGLVGIPVVAVPTSIGYGANLGGMAALFTMLNSCASGIVVVNIDNGFGAALAVHRYALSQRQTRTTPKGE